MTFCPTIILILEFDVCFLIDGYGGQLIATMDKNENNQMISIAYAMVEVEIRES